MVKSEVFNMVVHDGEALTYKIMVLPKNDPEVKAMRELEAGRGRAGGEEEAEGSDASADTVLANESGRPLPAPTPVANEQLLAFMATEQGERYYQEWNQGRITCKQVCLRSGAGLLAKFYSRRVEEEEEQKMLQLVLQEEAKLKPQGGEASGVTANSLAAPTAWPSYQLATPEVIQVDSQGDTPPQQAPMSSGGLPSAATTELRALLHSDASDNAFKELITKEANDRELAFAIAAGDISKVEGTTTTANSGILDEHVGRGEESSAASMNTHSGATNIAEGCESEGNATALMGTSVMAGGAAVGDHEGPEGDEHDVSASTWSVAAGALPVLEAVPEESTSHVDAAGAVSGTDELEGEASAAARPTEEGCEGNNLGPKQTDLKHWLKDP